MTADDVGPTSDEWRRLRDSASFQAALAQGPICTTPETTFGFLILGGYAAALAVFFLCLLRQPAGEPAIDRDLWKCYVGIAVVCALAAAFCFVRYARFARAPAMPEAARVLSKRGSEGYQYGSRCSMTLAFESGPELEARVDLATFGDVMVGDAGVAWYQDGVFLGFRKVAL